MGRAIGRGAAGTLSLGLVLAAVGWAAPVVADSGQCTASTRITQPPTALTELQSDLAWSVTRGAGVTVAVVDSGVDAANPHLTGAMAASVDLVPGGGPADADGHGTAVAGIIAARRIPGSAVAGLAPGARILSVRVFAGTSDEQVKGGTGPSVDRLAAGIRTAADRHAQIINVSLSTAVHEPALDAAVNYATSRGSLVVASAGNRDASLAVDTTVRNGARYPAGSAGAVGVAATDAVGVVTDATIHGPHVALSAPGQNVATTSSAGGDCVYATDHPAASFATAYVSAAAALVASAHPDETPAQWAYRLEATAVRADPDQRDDVSGWGSVQPYEAIALVPGPSVRGPVSPFDANAAAPLPPAGQPTVTVAHEPRMDAAAIQGLVVAGTVAAVLLVVIGTLGVLRRRRGAADPAPAGKGLYGRPGDEQEEHRG
ncbi:S8 family serine peptidase [Microbacterium mangrovi]|uniref:S8 family serine peptidase n=1 Tax=Microbacterium mangrovi TaxID=1348253 RepID=UPI00068CD332|nr:S8 family serine peptidase [Microbacterium mangrovi]